MSEFLKPMPDGKAPGWKHTATTPDQTEQVVVDATAFSSRNDRMGTSVSYGQGPEGYDRWIVREPNGGGAVTVPYIRIDGELYVGVNKTQRSAAGGPVTEVPRGFSLPLESHDDTAAREFEEETGVTTLSQRIKDLGGRPVNPNTTFFQADARKREGVKFYGLELNKDEVTVLRESDNPQTRVYEFTPELKGKITAVNEKLDLREFDFITRIYLEIHLVDLHK
ncbi:MAG: NUDIX hydrolase [Candidatus Levybacteria bacterium]|nr:NUDIX hydrolase [Candidatus Levybacteria bacterium]